MLSFFEFLRPDGSKQAVKGYKYAKPPANTKKFKASNAKLPQKVDLRKYMTNIEDQGELSSCVANAVAGAYEYLAKRYQDLDSYDVSRLFIYYNARTEEDDDVEDEGAIIYNAIESLKEYGACSEDSWPYDEDMVNEEPDEEAYDEAEEFLIEEAQLVPTDLNAWKQVLAEGYPIIFGLALYNSFDKHRKGVIPKPGDKEVSRASHSGHAMLCVGYSDPDKVFIVRNSWGDGWGDNGYCYIPYSYLINDEFNDGDSWIIRQIAPLDIDDEDWDDEESVLQDFESAIDEMSEEEYEEMLEDFGDIPLEHRICIIFLHGANADWELTEEELDEIADYLEDIFEQVGSSYQPAKVIRHCKKTLEDEELLEETVELLDKHLPRAVLATILSNLEDIMDADETSEEEEDFYNYLVETWQIEDDEDDEDDEDEY